MKLEQSEKLFVESLFKDSVLNNSKIDFGEVNLVRLTGDASTRRYYRIWSGQGSCVVCLDDPVVGKGNDFSFCVVQSVFYENKIRVPLILDKKPERGYVLEEDLGDTTLLMRLAQSIDEQEEFCLYKDAIDNIVKIQRIDVAKYDHDLFSLEFDVKKLMYECRFTVGNYLEKLLKLESELKLNKILTYLEEICTEIAQESMVLTHRDYHSRNIMIVDDEQVVIDFQDARKGIHQYDLVSLLEDTYYRPSDMNIINLKKYYWETYLKEEVNYHLDHFNHLYDLVTVQRTFKAIGSFAHIFLKRKDYRYLKYIGLGMEKIKSTLFKYPKYSKLRLLLSEIYYAN